HRPEDPSGLDRRRPASDRPWRASEPLQPEVRRRPEVAAPSARSGFHHFQNLVTAERAAPQPLFLGAEGGAEPRHLRLERIVDLFPRRQHLGIEHLIEPDHPLLEFDALLDQLAQAYRELAKVAVRLIAARRRKLDLALLLDGLLGRKLAFAHRAPDEQPGGKLHQPGGEPHTLGGIGERMQRPELARLSSSFAVEIGRRGLAQAHALAAHGLELLGSRESRSEGDRNVFVTVPTPGLPRHRATPVYARARRHTMPCGRLVVAFQTQRLKSSNQAKKRAAKRRLRKLTGRRQTEWTGHSDPEDWITRSLARKS